MAKLHHLMVDDSYVDRAHPEFINLMLCSDAEKVSLAKKIWDGNQPGMSYLLIAVMKADGPEMVFRLSQHVYEDWTTNPEIIMLDRSPHRSTSIGDIVQVDNTLYLCQSMGWAKLS